MSTTDLITLNVADRQYIQISKQIFLYEMKRKRIGVRSLSEEARLEDSETSLPTSVTSDWRVILQDSITIEDLRQGCISLFDHVNSGMSLTPIEVNHASRFLEYTEIHIKHHSRPENHLLEAIFPEEEHCQTRLVSSLINLLSLPSDTLRTVSLAFLDVGLLNSSCTCSIAVASTGLLPQLFESLKPHEIPLNERTFEFHRHITSIVGNLFICSPEDFKKIGKEISPSQTKKLRSEIINPIFQPFCKYLRYLITHPVPPTDFNFAYPLLSTMKLFHKHITSGSHNYANQDIRSFFEDLRKTMTDELASSLVLVTTGETLCSHLFDGGRDMTPHSWAGTFGNIIDQLGEGKQCSDFGVYTFQRFLSLRPKEIKISFLPDGRFIIRIDGDVDFLKLLPSKPLCALFTPTRPHCTVAILTLIHPFTRHHDHSSLLKDLKDGWFSSVFDALTPSKLPFTSENRQLHTQLIKMMNDRSVDIQRFLLGKRHVGLRNELHELYLAFHQQTKDYIVHLSLHPKWMPLLASSSPPFILTSELVRHLTDEEIIEIIDRIVALLESDSSLDDDTILRISTFHKYQLKFVYLPDLFRKAGRTKQQYFHALSSLLSLPIDHFLLRPFIFLLNPKPNTLQPTNDEWDDVDLETVGCVIPAINGNHLSFDHPSSNLNRQILKFTVAVLPQLSESASRLTPSQLARLIAPSLDIFSNFFFHQCSTQFEHLLKRESVFRQISILCEQRVIARCVGRVGFFSRVVTGLFGDRSFLESEWFLIHFFWKSRSSGIESDDRRRLRRRVHLILEEGWLDVLDTVIDKTTQNQMNQELSRSKGMMQFNGANLSGDSDWDDTNRKVPLFTILFPRPGTN
ncbi:hypothetical protein BLNAU_18968 [Blattamonas nauphoetae]|uniref:Uncharacterized protein n=1 Tax=Blattamonas nauphoetae TaxID=2049346 RepID=A0ABQ9X2X6_9EUKA|nr:hypothetical protein BLNAU_18968 [Blattamonas nauphoetae]